MRMILSGCERSDRLGDKLATNPRDAAAPGTVPWRAWRTTRANRALSDVRGTGLEHPIFAVGDLPVTQPDAERRGSFEEIGEAVGR